MYRCYIVTLYTAYTASQLRLGVGSPLRVHAWRGREMKEQKSVLGLSTIRRNRGVSLEQIAESTKISIRSLEAIEQGDFRKLPGGIYNTSYIRQYARAIEYDESALLAFYMREMAGSDGTVRNGANGNGGGGGVRARPRTMGALRRGGGPPARAGWARRGGAAPAQRAAGGPPVAPPPPASWAPSPVGRTPWSARVPPGPASRQSDIGSIHTSRPTGASTADRGSAPQFPPNVFRPDPTNQFRPRHGSHARPTHGVSVPTPVSPPAAWRTRSEEHTSELQSLRHLVCR